MTPGRETQRPTALLHILLVRSIFSRNPHHIFLDYLLTYLNPHVQWFSLSKVKTETKKKRKKCYEILEENLLDMHDFLLGR